VWGACYKVLLFLYTEHALAEKMIKFSTILQTKDPSIADYVQ